MITKTEAIEWYRRGMEDAHRDGVITPSSLQRVFDKEYGHVFEQMESPQLLHPLMQYFTYAHLPAHLQEISQPMAELVIAMLLKLPMNIETDAFVRKMLEAKDCAVRAKLYKGEAEQTTGQ